MNSHLPVEPASESRPICRIPLQAREVLPELFAFLDERRGASASARVFALMANCPDILRAFIVMADHIREGCGLDPALRELAIIMTCQTIGNRYEHARHWNIARRLGMPRSKLEVIWDFETSDAFTPLEKAVLRLACDASRAPEQVSQQIWDDVHSRLGDEQSLALLFSIGWYNMTARITGPLALELEPDLERL